MTTTARDRAVQAVRDVIPGNDDEAHWRHASFIVDEVLAAIREPDQAMVRAAYEAESDPLHYALDPDDSDFRAAFTAAIDAARGGENMVPPGLAPDNDGWFTMDTCPYRQHVDLWCVDGGEPYAKPCRVGDRPIGRLVSDQFKDQKYGWFGNQSNAGVPRKDLPDMIPVAWRPAVPWCPPRLIASCLEIPIEPPEEPETGGDNA